MVRLGLVGPLLLWLLLLYMVYRLLGQGCGRWVRLLRLLRLDGLILKGLLLGLVLHLHVHRLRLQLLVVGLGGAC